MTTPHEIHEIVLADLNIVMKDLRRRWYGAEPHVDYFAGEVPAALSTARDATATAVDLLADGDDSSRVAALEFASEVEPLLPGEAARTTLRVVLMGRTQAGKSTLLAAMTRLPAHADRIGKGAQRTSRDSAEGPWHAHPDITIVDPPGIGAAGGDDDAEVAFESVRDADVVIWVQSNDSSQQSSLDAITQLCVLGKPMLLVLNFRQDLSRGGALDRFLRRPEMTFRHESGHLARLGRHLDELGASWSAVALAHLGSAALADNTHPRRNELLTASGIRGLEDALLTELQMRAPVRRLLNPVDRVRSTTELVREAVISAEDRARDETDVHRRLADDISRRNRRSLAKVEEESRAQVRVIVANRTGWHSTRGLDGIGSAWDDEQAVLDAELDTLLRQFVHDLATQVDADRESAAVEWTTFAGERTKLQRGSSAWLNKAAKIGTALPALAPLIATNPITLGIAAVGLGIKAVFGKRINRWIDRKTSSREALDLKRRDSVGKQIAEHLVAIEQRALRRISEFADAERTRQDDEQRERIGLANKLEESAHVMGRSAAISRHALIALDTATARALLVMSGQARVAATVERAVRRPGVAMVAGAGPAGHAESVLFPARSIVEPSAIVAHAGPEPIAHAAFEAVFKLTGTVPIRHTLLEDGVLIIPAETVPEGLRLAWESMLTTYTDRSVHLR